MASYFDFHRLKICPRGFFFVGRFFNFLKKKPVEAFSLGHFRRQNLSSKNTKRSTTKRGFWVHTILARTFSWVHWSTTEMAEHKFPPLQLIPGPLEPRWFSAPPVLSWNISGHMAWPLRFIKHFLSNDVQIYEDHYEKTWLMLSLLSIFYWCLGGPSRIKSTKHRPPAAPSLRLVQPSEGLQWQKWRPKPLRFGRGKMEKTWENPVGVGSFYFLSHFIPHVYSLYQGLASEWLEVYILQKQPLWIKQKPPETTNNIRQQNPTKSARNLEPSKPLMKIYLVLQATTHQKRRNHQEL